MPPKAHVWSPWRSAHVEPDRMAVVTDDGDRATYAALVDHADRIGAALSASGVPEGTGISTDLAAGPELFALVLAALKYGFSLFPVNAHVDVAAARALRRRAGTALHVADDPAAVDGEVVGYRELVARSGHAARPAAREGRLLFATSGTTTDEHVVTGAARPHHPYRGVGVFGRYSAGREFGPHVMTDPVIHLGTLGPALYALQAGSGVVLTRRWSPGGMDALVREHRASSAFLGVDLLTEYTFAGGHGADLSTVFHGGSACPPWVKRKAIELYGPVLHEYYGTSEGVVSEISTAEWLRHPGSVGRPMAGLDVVVERDGSPAPAGVAGAISVRTRGNGSRAVLTTGDYGYVDADGYLYVLGRVADSGRSAEAVIEYNVRAMPGVRDVVALDDSGVTCLVEVVDGGSADWAPRIDAVVRGAGARLDDVLMFPSGALDRTDSGKISRAAAKRLVAARRAGAVTSGRNGG